MNFYDGRFFSPLKILLIKSAKCVLSLERFHSMSRMYRSFSGERKQKSKNRTTKIFHIIHMCKCNRNITKNLIKAFIHIVFMQKKIEKHAQETFIKLPAYPFRNNEHICLQVC